MGDRNSGDLTAPRTNRHHTTFTAGQRLRHSHTEVHEPTGWRWGETKWIWSVIKELIIFQLKLTQTLTRFVSWGSRTMCEYKKKKKKDALSLWWWRGLTKMMRLKPTVIADLTDLVAHLQLSGSGRLIHYLKISRGKSVCFPTHMMVWTYYFHSAEKKLET